MASSIPVNTVAFCRKCGKPLTQESRRDWQGVPYCEPCLDTVQAAETRPVADLRPEAVGQGSWAGVADSPSGATSAGGAASAAGTGPGASPGGPAAGAGPASSPGFSGAATGSGGSRPSGTFARPASGPRHAPPPGGSVSPVLAGILGFIPGVGAVYNGQFAKGILHVVIFGLLVSIVAADGTGDLRPMFVFLVILMGIYMPIEAYRTARAIERGGPVEEFSGILSALGDKRPSPAGGVVLIALGVVFLLNTLGYWRLGDLVRFWPVLLIAVGIFMLYRSVSEQAREDRLSAYGGSGLRVSPMERPMDPPQRDSATAVDSAARKPATAEPAAAEPGGAGEESAESGV